MFHFVTTLEILASFLEMIFVLSPRQSDDHVQMVSIPGFSFRFGSDGSCEPDGFSVPTMIPRADHLTNINILLRKTPLALSSFRH